LLIGGDTSEPVVRPLADADAYSTLLKDTLKPGLRPA
jgi:hypothetical protein